MDPGRWERALKFIESSESFFKVYFEKIDRMCKITEEMNEVSNRFTLLKERSEKTRAVASVGLVSALILWFFVASSLLSVGLGAVAVAGLSAGGATFIFLTRQQKAEEELVRKMDQLAAELRQSVEPLRPKLYDVYSASIFEGTKRKIAKLLRHGARVVELLSTLNTLQQEVRADMMSQVAQQYTRTVEEVQVIRSKIMTILEN